MGRRKILYTIANSLLGGVEAILLNVLKHIDKTKYKTTVIVTHQSGPLGSEFSTYADELIDIT